MAKTKGQATKSSAGKAKVLMKPKAAKRKNETPNGSRSNVGARASAAEMARLKKTQQKYKELKALMLTELRGHRGLWALDKDTSVSKPFKCGICGATFTRKDKIARHIREIHEGIKRKRPKNPPKKRDRTGESAKRWAKMKEQHLRDPSLKLKRQMEVAYRTKLYRERKAKKAAELAKVKEEGKSERSSSGGSSIASKKEVEKQMMV